MTSEYQGSFPYLTVVCISLITMNLAVFPVDYGWRRLFPEFATLPKHIRRHDTNLLMRVVMGPLLCTVFVYIVLKIWQDVNYFFEERKFITCCTAIFLMVDIFDLTQKRRFEWHPYVHHIIQTLYALYFLEWGGISKYNNCFPTMGLILFSLSHKPMLGLFPLRRVAKKDAEIVRTFAKFAFADVVFAIIVGLGVMLALIIKHREHLQLGAMIVQPIAFLFFNAIDIPFYTFIYKIAYGKPESKKAEVEKKEDIKRFQNASDAPSRRSRSSLLSIEIGELMNNPRNSVLGIPFYVDEALDDDDDDDDNNNNNNNNDWFDSNSLVVANEHE